MFKYLPDLISGFFIAREMGASSQAGHYWESAYHAKMNEMVTHVNMLKAEQDMSASLRSEAVSAHNNCIELMKQMQETEKENLTLIRAYTGLIEQIEELGMRVDDDNCIVVPEMDEDEFDEDEESEAATESLEDEKPLE